MARRQANRQLLQRRARPTMDTLTHALSGAVLARATAPRSPSAGALSMGQRTVAGFLAAAFPDADIVFRLFDPLAYLNMHRGITHSVLLLPLWALLLAAVLALLFRGRRHWRAFVGVCALGLGTHIAGDVITAYGTMILAPFSELRVALPTTFIIDPYFSAILLLGLIASLAWRPRRAAGVSLALLVGYVVTQGMLHRQAVAVGETYARSENLRGATVQALPQPLSPFNWKVIVSHGEDYYETYMNLVQRVPPPPAAEDAGLLAHIASAYRPVQDLHWQAYPRFGDTREMKRVGRDVWERSEFAPFRKFAMYPVLYRMEHDRDQTCAWFMDLRFTLEGRIPPFRFGMCRNGADQTWRLRRLSRSD